jgi:hypothetical protein
MFHWENKFEIHWFQLVRYLNMIKQFKGNFFGIILVNTAEHRRLN